jgi:hypothetical protein
LEEEEVADVEEVGLVGAEEAFELGEIDVRRGFEDFDDVFRIARSCVDGGVLRGRRELGSWRRGTGRRGRMNCVGVLRLRSG